MDRRTFVKGTFLGGAGLLLHGFAVRAQSDASAPTLPPIETHGLPQVKPSPLGMPGLFPGRVVEVSNANAIARNRVAQPEIKVMIERGMKELTSESSLLRPGPGSSGRLTLWESRLILQEHRRAAPHPKSFARLSPECSQLACLQATFSSTTVMPMKLTLAAIRRWYLPEFAS